MSPAASGRAAVLWTGGKDCALALDRARARGLPVDALFTFAPPRARFRAHPLPRIRAQARALGLPHRVLDVEPPYTTAYERHFRRLRRDGYAWVVTGDLDLIGGAPSWVRERAASTGLRVLRPLWRQSRYALLRALGPAGIRAEITAVRVPHLGVEWLGRVLDRRTIDELVRLARRKRFDASGEQGEYHTMVLDAPGFCAEIAPGPRTVRGVGNLRYLAGSTSVSN
ncbi:MAG: hypothetical protein ACREB9_03535 [Thermoplasmata archaeon]